MGGGTSPRRAGEDGAEVLMMMREVAVQEIELGLKIKICWLRVKKKGKLGE